MLSWENIRDQFGQEYATSKDFKREFRDMLSQVCTVYPDAKIDGTPGGLILRPSPPPITRTMVGVPRTLENQPLVDKPVRRKLSTLNRPPLFAESPPLLVNFHAESPPPKTYSKIYL